MPRRLDLKKPSLRLVPRLYRLGKVPTYLNANFMSLGGGYLNLFYAKGLACFPGNGCFAFNNLRKRERGRLII